MSVFVNDTFTDTNGTLLSDHTGETGATWTIHPTRTSTLSIHDGRVYQSGASGEAVYYASGAPAGSNPAEYDVEASMYVVTTAKVNWSGPFGRLDTTALTGYFAMYADGAIHLFKCVSGTYTQLARVGLAYAAGSTYPVKLEIRDAAKKVYVDTGSGLVERISNPNNEITAAGRAGIRFDTGGSTTTGQHWDNFSATDLATGGTPQQLDATATDGDTARAALRVDRTLEATGTDSDTARAALSVGSGAELDASARDGDTARAALSVAKPLSGRATDSDTARAALRVVRALEAIAVDGDTGRGALYVGKPLAATGADRDSGRAALQVGQILVLETLTLELAFTRAVERDLAFTRAITRELRI